MNDVQVGELIYDDVERDAIHIAILPVTAGERLQPGQFITLHDNVAIKAINKNQALGVVDPFLKSEVKYGQKFYMFVMPNTIVGMKYTWRHHKIPDQTVSLSTEYSKAKDWLTAHAIIFNISYDQLINALNNYYRTGERYCLGEETTDEAYVHCEEMWENFYKVTGFPRIEDKEHVPFRCAC